MSFQEQPIIKREAPVDFDSDDEDKPKRAGRRKIKIEYIEDKSRRHITFSKRKAGIMKKAYELSTLTGTQVLLLVASETGHVYTFATPKLQPMITQPEGKNMIQACLNAPDRPESAPPMPINRVASYASPMNSPARPPMMYSDVQDVEEQNIMPNYPMNNFQGYEQQNEAMYPMYPHGYNMPPTPNYPMSGRASPQLPHPNIMRVASPAVRDGTPDFSRVNSPMPEPR